MANGRVPERGTAALGAGFTECAYEQKLQVMRAYSQKIPRIAKPSHRWDFTVFYPWDGLAIRGTNSSVAAKGLRR